MKSKKTKSIKLLALSTAVCTAIGATSVLTSVDAFASSITQESGNDTRGELEIVTNPFKTFEDAKDFVDNTLESLLNNSSYRTSIVPLDFPNIEKGYVLITNLSYNSETFSKSEAEALANKLIAVADVTITGNNLSGTIKPKEESNVPSGTIKPKEEGNTPSGTIKPKEEGNVPSETIKPKEEGNAPSGTIKPKEEGNAPSGTIKPKEESNVPSGTIKPKEEGNTPSGTIKPTEEGNAPSGTIKPIEEGNKPSKSLEDKNKLDTKLKEDKINKSINKSEGDLGKKETKSVLPRTGETTSSLLLIGVIMAGLGISFAVKRKQG
ncbi:LPXTG cell wall anchor domain-containing protein [uncultured Gemella sp.]|uniref:LPXTG cell wall anchor domain-containing protein n=1 Tax=uncultured Gemella sp. TaxID=254352 RepID=UPI0028D48894|nr:LPXTG cell wall anchor domain-containing protein [uncultured Gemella sp.]